MSVFTKVVANFITTLASNISIGGTTATLQTNVTKDGDTLPNGLYCFTINQGKANEQHLLCTLTGTSITGIQSVNRLGVVTAGASKDARINDEVKITDYVNLKLLVDDVDALNTIVAGLIISGAPDASTTLRGVSMLTANPDTVIGTATMTIASPAVVTKTAHGLIAGDSIKFSTTGALPTGVTAGVTYYVIATGLTANDFRFSATYGGAAVNTSGSQSGVHTVTRTTPRAVSENDTRMLTQGENDAASGADGIPSSTNKFLTQDSIYADIDQQQTTQNATTQFGQANTSGNRNRVVQSFIPTETKIRGVRFYKGANVGTFTGDVIVELVADNAGNPDTTVLATQTLTNAQWNAAAVGELFVLFGTEYTGLVIGSTYWLVFRASTADTSNHPTLGVNSAGGYTDGQAKYWNTTDGYITQTFDLYFRTINGTTGKTDGFVIDLFLSSNTWVKPTNAKLVEVTLIGGGGGGGGGSGDNATTFGSGGAGGAGGGVSWQKFRPETLTSTVAVTVGIGGTAGTGAAATNTAGGAGGAGGNTSFGSYLTATGGGGGGGGLVNGGAPTAASAGVGNLYNGGLAGVATTTIAPTGGGAGGAGNQNPGGAGGARQTTATLAGGTNGAGGDPGTAGGAGNMFNANEPVGGTGGGGGGGGSSLSNAGATGGAGGRYGAGGGGGGSGFINGANGGPGAQGIAVVISYF